MVTWPVNSVLTPAITVAPQGTPLTASSPAPLIGPESVSRSAPRYQRFSLRNSTRPSRRMGQAISWDPFSPGFVSVLNRTTAPSPSTRVSPSSVQRNRACGSNVSPPSGVSRATVMVVSAVKPAMIAWSDLPGTPLAGSQLTGSCHSRLLAPVQVKSAAKAKPAKGHAISRATMLHGRSIKFLPGLKQLHSCEVFSAYPVGAHKRNGRGTFAVVAAPALHELRPTGDREAGRGE